MAESTAAEKVKTNQTCSTSTSTSRSCDGTLETSNYHIRVSSTPPSLEECMHYVRDDSCGAISSFVGTTRNDFHGKKVLKLSYEGYVPMAVKELERLCHLVMRVDSESEKDNSVDKTTNDDGNDNNNDKDNNKENDTEAVKAFQGRIHKIAMQHILGDCPVGHASVVIAASSTHRRDAMECVTFLIDALKARVPIWKREVYEEKVAGCGEEEDVLVQSVWKENVEWREGRKQRVMVKVQDDK